MMPPQLLELYAQPSQMWGGVDPEKSQRKLSSQVKSDLFFLMKKQFSRLQWWQSGEDQTFHAEGITYAKSSKGTGWEMKRNSFLSVVRHIGEAREVGWGHIGKGLMYGQPF